MFTEQRARWLYQNYVWLEANLPARQDGTKAKLILPTAEHFPMRRTGDHAFAEAVFHRTREFMGLTDWPCHLMPQEDNEQKAHAAMFDSGAMGYSKGPAGAAGTFFSDGQGVEITYSPALLHDPVSLISTYAHELSHYLLATVKTDPPCGWAEHEPLTDLAAVHEGFGVFLCNGAFTFSQWGNNKTQGWQSSRRGYLNEAELGFATGIFCVRSGITPETIGPHLKPNPREVFWDSLDYIAGLNNPPSNVNLKF